MRRPLRRGIVGKDLRLAVVRSAASPIRSGIPLLRGTSSEGDSALYRRPKAQRRGSPREPQVPPPQATAAAGGPRVKGEVVAFGSAKYYILKRPKERIVPAIMGKSSVRRRKRK